MDEYAQHWFQQLPSTSRQTVISLIRSALRDRNGHEVHAGSSGVKSKPHSYWVTLSGNRSASDPVYDKVDLTHHLIHSGMAVSINGEWNRWRFPVETLAWFQELNPPADAEIRVAIGKLFFERATGVSDEPRLNLSQLADPLRIPPSRVYATIRGLVGAGLLDELPSADEEHEWDYRLSERGYRWAVSDFSPQAIFSPSVSVTVELQYIFDTIETLQVSEEQRRAFELKARQLDRELKQGKLSWPVVRDALDMAANAKELAVPLVSVLAGQRDLFQQAIQQISGL